MALINSPQWDNTTQCLFVLCLITHHLVEIFSTTGAARLRGSVCGPDNVISGNIDSHCVVGYIINRRL